MATTNTLLWIPAYAGYGPTVHASMPKLVYLDGTLFDMNVLAFDGNAGRQDTFVHYQCMLPDLFSVSKLNVVLYWTAESGPVAGENVSWDVFLLGRADTETIDIAHSDSLTVNTTFTTALDLHKSLFAFSAPSIAEDDMLFMKVRRDYDEADGGTAMDEDALLIGIEIQEEN